MKVLQLALVFSVLTTTQSWGSVKAYFNHNPSTSYKEPYRNLTRPGDNLEQVLINEVNKATRSVYVAVQELRLPLLAKALVAKRAQGVDVRVILEKDYHFDVMTQRDHQDDQHEATKKNELIALVDTNRDQRASPAELLDRDAVYMLHAGKVPVMDDTADGSRGSGLMHHKFIIVDGQSTVISSANFTLSCIHGDLLNPASRGNPNSMVTVQSTAVARIFEEEFAIMWGNGKRGTFGQNKPYRGPRSVMVGGAKIIIQFSPTSQRVNWVESVNGLIAQVIGLATKSFYAALFVHSDQLIGNVIENRSNLGVKVGVLVENKFAFRDYSELMDMAGLGVPNQACRYEPGNKPWKKLTGEYGIPNLNSGDVLHHKFGVVDNRYVVMGSENWSNSANFTNDETAVVIENAQIAGQYTQEYARLRANARMGTPAAIKAEVGRLEARCAGQAF